jgi:CheY-like chemotaxis protein
LLVKDKIPTILIPRHSIRGDSNDALRAGFSGYLRQPFETSELKEILLTIFFQNTAIEGAPKEMITRFIAKELHRKNIIAVIAAFDIGSQDISSKLAGALEKMQLQSILVSSMPDLIRVLFEHESPIVFYPSLLSAGERRQLGIALEGGCACCYETSQPNIHANKRKPVAPIDSAAPFLSQPFEAEKISAIIHSQFFGKKTKKPTHLFRIRRSA